MTEKDAIKEIVKEICEGCISAEYSHDKGNCKRCGFDIAIKALNKQIPKKVIDVTDYFGEDELEYTEKGCPNCNYHDCGLEDSYDNQFRYCPMCGQKLDWI